MKSKEIIQHIKIWQSLVKDAERAIKDRDDFFNKTKIKYGCSNEFGNKDTFKLIMFEVLGKKVVEESNE